MKAAGVAVRPPGGWGRRSQAKPANGVTPDYSGETGPVYEASPDPPATAKPAQEVIPDSGLAEAPGRSPSASACEPYRDFIELSLSKGRNAKAVWQDLVDDHGFRGSCQSVKRFVGKLYGAPASEARAIIVTPPGKEAQVDYGSGPMVRDPHSGR